MVASRRNALVGSGVLVSFRRPTSTERGRPAAQVSKLGRSMPLMPPAGFCVALRKTAYAGILSRQKS